MPTYLPQIEPNRTGSLNSWDIPFNDWLGIKLGVGLEDRAGEAVERWSEDTFDDSPEMRPDAANRTFGIPGHLKFTMPVKVQTAMRKKERKERELRYTAFLNAASHDSLSWKAAAGTAAMMLGSVSHPLDLGMMFIPFIGEARLGAGVARFGARAALNRGIIGTTEDLAKIGVLRRFPNLTASVINGTLGNAVAEIPIGLQKWSDQADYGLGDSAANIAFGGVAGGAFHGLGKVIGAALRRVGVRLENLDPETAAEVLRREAADAVAGREPSGHEAVRWSEEEIAREIRAKNLFDEAETRAAAERLVRRELSDPLFANSTELLNLAQAEASRGTQAGKILGRLIQRFENGERDTALFQQIAALLDRHYDPQRLGPQEAFEREKFFGPAAQETEATKGTLKAARAELFQIDRVLEDLLKRLHGADEVLARQLQGNIHNLQLRRAALAIDMEKAETLIKRRVPLSDAELAAHRSQMGPEVLQEQVTTERAKRISDYVEREKARHEIEVTGKIKDEVAARIAAQQAQGRVLPDKEVDQWIATDDADIDSRAAALTKDAQTIEQQMVMAAGIEGKEAVTARIEKIKASAAAEAETKAINEAINCVYRGRTE